MHQQVQKEGREKESKGIYRIKPFGEWTTYQERSLQFAPLRVQQRRGNKSLQLELFLFQVTILTLQPYCSQNDQNSMEFCPFRVQ